MPQQEVVPKAPSYEELLRQIDDQRAKNAALSLQVKYYKKKERRAKQKDISSDNPVSAYKSPKSMPSEVVVGAHTVEEALASVALSDAEDESETRELVAKRCKELELERTAEQIQSALTSAKGHQHLALAILAGEPAALDTTYGDGSDSDADTVENLSDEDMLNKEGSPNLSSASAIEYGKTNERISANNRLDVDDNGESIFIDIRNISSADTSDLIGGQAVYSTAGYDHSEEALMDVTTVEADWSKLRPSKEEDTVTQELERLVSKRNIKEGEWYANKVKSTAGGVSSSGSPSAAVPAQYSTFSPKAKRPSVSSSAQRGAGAGGGSADELAAASDYKRERELQEKRRILERQREISRLPARESWKYTSDQPPIANIKDFCFPSGVLVQYLSRSAAEYLVGEERDRYHVMELTNPSGGATFACVLTSTKVVSVNFAPPPPVLWDASPGSSRDARRGALTEAEVIDRLAHIMHLQTPARIIRTFMRRFVKFIKKKRWDNVLKPGFNGNYGGQAHGKKPATAEQAAEPAERVSRRSRMMQMLADAAGGRSALHNQNTNNTPNRTTNFSSLFSGNTSPQKEATPSGQSGGLFGSSFFDRGSRWMMGGNSGSNASQQSAQKSISKDGLVSSVNNTARKSPTAVRSQDETEDLLGLSTGADSTSATTVIKSSPTQTQASEDGFDSISQQNQRPSHTVNIPRRMSMQITRKNISVSETISNAMNNFADFADSLKSMPAGIAGLPMTLPPAEGDMPLIENTEDNLIDMDDESLEASLPVPLAIANTTAAFSSFETENCEQADTTKSDATHPSERIEHAHNPENMCVVAEIAYCLVSTKPIQAVGFKILKAMADAERYSVVEGCDTGEGDVDARMRSRTVSGNSIGSGGRKTFNNSTVYRGSGYTSPDQTTGSNASQPETGDASKFLDLLGQDENSDDVGTRSKNARSKHSPLNNLTTIHMNRLSQLRNLFLHRVHQQLCHWSHLGGLQDFLDSNFSTSLNASARKKRQYDKQGRMVRRSRRFRTNSFTNDGKKKSILALSGRNGPVNFTTSSSPSLTINDTKSKDIADCSVDSMRGRSTSQSMVSDIVPQEVHAVIDGYVDPSEDKPEGFVVNLSLLPSVDEIAAAIMFSYLNSSIIFKLVNLLLMEKSLVICGKQRGIVSLVALAVKNLILPFRWEGVFVPLVPDSARELFGAPVPFILGTTISPRDSDVSPNSAILHLQEDTNTATALKRTLDVPDVGSFKADSPRSPGTLVDKRQGKSRLSYVGRKTKFNEPLIVGSGSGSGKPGSSVAGLGASVSGISTRITLPETVAWFIRLPDSLNADMPHDEELERLIDDTKSHLQRLRARQYMLKWDEERKEHTRKQKALYDEIIAKDPDAYFKMATFVPSTPPSLEVQYLSSMSVKEQRAVAHLMESMYEHNVRFCGDAIDPTAWRRYVRFNDTSGEEEFYPNWFMEPVRRHVEFQEAVVQTQLFVGFMDQVRKESISKDSQRMFIRDWVGFRIHIRKKWKRITL